MDGNDAVVFFFLIIFVRDLSRERAVLQVSVHDFHDSPLYYNYKLLLLIVFFFSIIFKTVIWRFFSSSNNSYKINDETGSRLCLLNYVRTVESRYVNFGAQGVTTVDDDTASCLRARIYKSGYSNVCYYFNIFFINFFR